ncbi:MAG TPA: lysophospholipid acyltransferase family protein [Candidatus Dormibacteraeota bacterium]
MRVGRLPSGRSRPLPRPLETSYGAAARLTRVMPPRPLYGLAGAGGVLWYLGSRAQRRNALANYAAVLGLPQSNPRVAATARAAFANYGRMLADFVLIGALGPDELRGRVTIDGREHADAALSSGRGCIMAVPHMGSWDIGGSYAGALGYRIAAVAERFPGSLDDAVVETRQRFGLRVIPLGRAAVRAIQQELGEGAIVALLCDLPHGPGVEVEMFGRRATVPAGPASFACKAGAPLLPAYVRMTAPGRYHITIEEPIPTAGRGVGREATRDLMQEVARRFEAFIGAYPEQWYAFRPMFA